MATNYRDQISWLEAQYQLEKEEELRVEEERRQKLLNGKTYEEDEANRESELKPKVYPTFKPTKVYRSRAEWLIQEGL